jgi:ParB family chromosome partitioning protein
MQVTDLPLAQLKEALWNPNRMDEVMLHRLRKSIQSYGLVENLVVRPDGDGAYEVLAGNQRLQVLRELGFSLAPCVVMDLDDAQARLLSQALNRIEGEDDLGLRAELLREVLAGIPQEQVMALLPETPQSLAAATALGQQTLDQYLQAWEEARDARLHHYTFQLTTDQIQVIEQALAYLLPQAKWGVGLRSYSEPWLDTTSPFGEALYYITVAYAQLERGILREGVKARMERARKQGKRIGRPRVTDRKGFRPRLQIVLERISAGSLSRRKAAKELKIGYATLKRILDKQGSPSQAKDLPEQAA